MKIIIININYKSNKCNTPQKFEGRGLVITRGGGVKKGY